MKSRYYSAIIVFCLFILPTFVSAQTNFVSLVGIPGVPNNGQDLGAYFNALYRLSISLAALLAVIKIIGAGAKYMLTDIVPAKGEALADIKGALLGLLVIIAAVIILSTINRNILNTNLEFTQVGENATSADNTDTQASTPPSLSEARSQSEACDIIERSGNLCEVNSNPHSLCNSYYSVRTGSDAEQCDGEEKILSFCEDVLNGALIGNKTFISDNRKCIYTENILSDFRNERYNEIISNTCTEINNGPCQEFACESINVYDLGSDGTGCNTTCNTFGGQAPRMPRAFSRANLPQSLVCVVPNNNISDLNVDANTTYYVGDEPVNLLGQSSINGFVIVSYREALFDRTGLVNCSDVTPSIC